MTRPGYDSAIPPLVLRGCIRDMAYEARCEGCRRMLPREMLEEMQYDRNGKSGFMQRGSCANGEDSILRLFL